MNTEHGEMLADRSSEALKVDRCQKGIERGRIARGSLPKW